MSKKLWIGGCLGCLFVILLVGGIVGGLGYWGFSKAQGLVQGIKDAEASVTQLRVDFPFTAPALDDPLNPMAYQHYLDARAGLGGVIAKHPTLNSVFTSLAAGQAPSVQGMQVFTLMGELPKAVQDAANVMRGEGISFQEFAHYSRLTLMTIKDGADNGDAQLSPLWDKVTTAADELDTSLAEMKDNTTNQPLIQVAPYIESIDASELPEETKAQIRAQLATLKDDPALLVLEAALAMVTSQMP